MADGRTLDETAEIMGALRHQAAALRVLAREKFGWCCRGPFPYGRKRLRQLDAIYDTFVLRADIALASAPAYLFEKRRAMTPDISWVYTANACWHLVYIVGWGKGEMPVRVEHDAGGRQPDAQNRRRQPHRGEPPNGLERPAGERVLG